MRRYTGNFYLLSVGCTLLALLGTDVAKAGNDADPLLTMVNIEELEWRDTDADNVVAWDAEAWIGRDRDKLWLKSEGETSSDETEEFELQLLYGRPIAPNWDIQLGWRGDFQPQRPRNWLAVGVQGLAPGFIETEATAFISTSGRYAARVKASYEMLFTQKLSLEPKVELNWYADDDEINELGSGLSSIELGLRLHYAVRRELLPYIGLNWEKSLGDTADLVRADGGDSSDLQIVAGLRFWF
jgi:copper resistance protein B